MSTLRVNNVNEVGGDSVITAGILDGGSLPASIPADKLPAGSILQVVRATDSTLRQTTSTTFVDVPGMSITITPTSSSSRIILLFNFRTEVVANGNSTDRGFYQITDSSDNVIPGSNAEFAIFGVTVAAIRNQMTLMGEDNPNTTSATTYKLKFRTHSGNRVELENDANQGQMYAIEVAA